ncbi:hypothetical protein [Streptomyces mirabilis]|uniref:hypothetical protein n=1 Tax=Streptomyces mirabilis TaxID=68239 RepID=UPI0036AA5431
MRRSVRSVTAAPRPGRLIERGEGAFGAGPVAALPVGDVPVVGDVHGGSHAANDREEFLAALVEGEGILLRLVEPGPQALQLPVADGEDGGGEVALRVWNVDGPGGHPSVPDFADRRVLLTQ